MTWLALWAVLQVGLMPNDVMVSYLPQQLSHEYTDTNYVGLVTELRLFDNHVFVGGTIKTEVQKAAGDGYDFIPESSAYAFRVGARFGGLEIGWLHLCAHPVLPFYYAQQPVIGYDQWYDDVYIRFSGTINIIGGRQ